MGRHTPIVLARRAQVTQRRQRASLRLKFAGLCGLFARSLADNGHRWASQRSKTVPGQVARQGVARPKAGNRCLGVASQVSVLTAGGTPGAAGALGRKGCNSSPQPAPAQGSPGVQPAFRIQAVVGGCQAAQQAFRLPPPPLPSPLTARRLPWCRGAVGAARELALGTRPWEQRGRDPPYVAFCLKLTAMLAAHGAIPVVGAAHEGWSARCRHADARGCRAAPLHPISASAHVLLLLSTTLLAAALQLVFDGCRLPAKAGTNAARRQRRGEARRKAQALLAEVGGGWFRRSTGLKSLGACLSL